MLSNRMRWNAAIASIGWAVVLGWGAAEKFIAGGDGNVLLGLLYVAAASMWAVWAWQFAPIRIERVS